MADIVKMRRKKPSFLRQDGHKKVRLGNKWRRPKGIQNKMRLHKKGYRKSVSVGYSTATEIKGLHRSGLAIVMISNVDELKKIDPKKQGIIIGKRVGNLKRIQIIEAAQKSNITIINIKKPADFVKKIEEKIAAKKKSKQEKEKAAKKKDKKALEEKVASEEKKDDKAESKKEETKESEDKKKDGEKKSSEEKKKLDKVLTKKMG